MLKGIVRLPVLLTMTAVISCLFLIMLGFIHAGDTKRTGMLSVHGQSFSVGCDKNVIGVYTPAGKRICTYKAGEGDGKFISSCISDLDSDGADELLLVVGKEKMEYGEYLLILKPVTGVAGARPDAADYVRSDDDDGKLTDAAVRSDAAGAARQEVAGDKRETMVLKQLYRFDMGEINPWKVQTCDVDGDGRKEISVGVYKKAVFHPVFAKRPFIYDWADGHMSPKWLGSRLARPFDDYVFSDINSDGKDELISDELLADGRKAVNSYGWKGFGFESTGGSRSYEDILGLRSATGSSIEIKAVLNGRSKWIGLHFENGGLVEDQ